MNLNTATASVTIYFPGTGAEVDARVDFTFYPASGRGSAREPAELVDAVAHLEDGSTVTFDALEAAGVDGAALADALLRGV